MDIGHLTDVLPYAFSVAANFGQPLLHQSIEASNDVWTAITVPDAMPDAQRNLQLVKLIGSSTGFGISAFNGSIEGCTGFAIADGEALMELEKAGHQWRMTHTGGPLHRTPHALT